MITDLVMGLLGGLLIGTAGALYLLVNGRVMGASGIFGALLDGSARETAAERLAFLAGLVGVPGAVGLAIGARTYITDQVWAIIAAGLLVGVGTRLANGCTSGHGVCGISRLSLRGIAATAVYIAAGVVTITLARHGLGVL